MQGLALPGLVEVLRRRTFAGAVVRTGVNTHAKDAAQFFRAERSERLKGNGKVCAKLQAGVQDAGRAVHVFLGHLPGLHVGNVFVADTGNVHGLLEGLAEVEGFHVFLQGLPAGLNGGKCFCVNGLRLQVGRHGTAEILVREHHGAVYEVTEDGHQLTVVAALEILPGEVVVLGLRRIGGEHIAQHVFLSGEIPLVFVHPHRPVAGSGNFVALQVKKFIGRHIVRQDIVAIGLEHGGEHNAVEHNVVLADKMHEARFRIFPPLLPALRQQLLRIGDIADGGVEPHIEHLALCALHRNGDAPVQVTGHGAGLQAAVQPAFALAVHIGFPLLVLFQDPVPEPGLILVQREVPVLGLHLFGRGAGKGALGVDEFLRA